VSLAPYVHVAEPLTGGEVGSIVPLGPDDEHHLRRVLRPRTGAEVVLADGRGHVAGGRLTSDGVALTATPVTTARPTPRLTVVQALPKARRFDEVVRQVTELGADRIVPVMAERSVARVEGDRATKAVERWRAVARAAAEQARRAWLPEVTTVTRLGALASALAGSVTLVAHPSGARPLPELVPSGAVALAVAIGPEGGWSDDEVAALVTAGATTATLGPTVLRTEHAAAAALAVLAATTGRWG
jgi:16S rRNA (uracil1498-N3)-methyltransferase